MKWSDIGPKHGVLVALETKYVVECASDVGSLQGHDGVWWGPGSGRGTEEDRLWGFHRGLELWWVGDRVA